MFGLRRVTSTYLIMNVYLTARVPLTSLALRPLDAVPDRLCSNMDECRRACAKWEERFVVLMKDELIGSKFSGRKKIKRSDPLR